MHEMMPMAGTGITLLGMSLEVFLMYASGIFYVICAAVLWKPFREEKNELLGALFAFLVYQAISMVTMGYGMQHMNMFAENIASLAIIVGSVYMLKFPFSSFSQGVRSVSFTVSLIAALALYVWFMLTAERQMLLMTFAIWYDVFVNGVVVGCFMLYVGFRSSEQWLRIKALGGGTGVASCCIVSNVAMLGGSVLISSTFQFLAPIIIVMAILVGRQKQKQTQPASVVGAGNGNAGNAKIGLNA